jgi:hypothetical protein
MDCLFGSSHFFSSFLVSFFNTIPICPGVQYKSKFMCTSELHSHSMSLSEIRMGYLPHRSSQTRCLPRRRRSHRRLRLRASPLQAHPVPPNQSRHNPLVHRPTKQYDPRKSRDGLVAAQDVLRLIICYTIARATAATARCFSPTAASSCIMIRGFHDIALPFAAFLSISRAVRSRPRAFRFPPAYAFVRTVRRLVPPARGAHTQNRSCAIIVSISVS